MSNRELYILERNGILGLAIPAITLAFFASWLFGEFPLVRSVFSGIGGGVAGAAVYLLIDLHLKYRRDE